jgi:hypothetical protein
VFEGGHADFVQDLFTRDVIIERSLLDAEGERYFTRRGGGITFFEEERGGGIEESVGSRRSIL